MNLYQIDNALLQCEILDENTAVNTQTGELIDIQALETLQLEREEKLEGIALWIKNLKADAAAIAAEIKTLQERKKAAESKAATLVSFLSDYLNGEKFSTPRVAISYRRSEKLETVDGVFDIQTIPEEYLTRKEPELNKDAIKKAIKEEGLSFIGLYVKQNNNIQIK